MNSEQEHGHSEMKFSRKKKCDRGGGSIPRILVQERKRNNREPSSVVWFQKPFISVLVWKRRCRTAS
jgi:hypothetical protein